MQGKAPLLDRERQLVPMDGPAYEPEDPLQKLLAESTTNAVACWPDGKIQVEF